MTRPVTAETLSDEQIRELIAQWSADRDKLDARPSVAGEAARDAHIAAAINARGGGR